MSGAGCSLLLGLEEARDKADAGTSSTSGTSSASSASSGGGGRGGAMAGSSGCQAAGGQSSASAGDAGDAGDAEDADQASCADGAKDGAETDVDCGGPACPRCWDGARCAVNGDCESGVCNSISGTCLKPTCMDHVKNGAETDVDCGGTSCPGCGLWKGCATSWDCWCPLVCDAMKKCE